MAAQAYKHEEVAKTPAGYRVRSVKRGSHVVRVAFPPGPRRKGAGKVVEILHPKSETNPSCIVSNQVRSNPGELIIFGNPSKRKRRNVFFDSPPERMGGHEGWKAEIVKRLETAYKHHRKSGMPHDDALRETLRTSVAGPAAIAEFKKRVGNPSTQAAKRATRERAARIRGARLNPGKMTVDFDNARKQFRATMVGVMGGMTKAQAREILKKKGNPREQVGEHQGVAMYFEGISYNAPALKLYGYSTDLALKRAIERKLRKSGRANPRKHSGEFKIFWRGRYKYFRTLEAARDFANEVHRKTKIIVAVEKANPDQSEAAVRLFEKFHGRDPKEITEKHVSAAMRKDYTALGDLEHLKVITPLGQTVQFDFEGDGVKLASSPDGKQLYCIGGNQNLSSCLDAASLEKDFIDLGECVQVQYLARKVHANFEPVSYYHKFGEKTGERPQLAYNKLQRQIFFVGGNYFIDTKQGVSPGIEN